MSKYRIISFLLAVVICVSLVGCGSPATDDSAETEPEAKLIILKEKIPPVYAGTSYDLEQILIPVENVKYKYTAKYTDSESGKEKKLTVKGGKITPKTDSDIQVTITAEKDEKTENAELILSISQTADVMDNLLSTDGAAGSADSGVTKTVEKSEEFCKGDSSASSLKTVFTNPAEGDKGTKLLDLSHYSLMAYYSDRVWDNSAVTMWVYNPMQEDVSLKLTSFDSVAAKSIHWNSPENSQIQYAKAGQWTQISFSLYQMDIRQVLYNSYDGVRNDSLVLCGRYNGNEECTIYIDGVNVVAASSLADLQTGYVDPALPAGDYSDLLATCKVYNSDMGGELSKSTKGNGSKDSYCIGADSAIGRPTFYVDFPQETDISGFDYLKFDVFAEKCYPYAAVSIRYIDENGEENYHTAGYDFYREQWRTLYLNLRYLKDVDLTRVVGFSFSINVYSHFVENSFNCVYFDNVSLYEHSQNEPELPAPIEEDYDLISGPMLPSNIKVGTNGVCKVSEDETGTSKSNSMLLFWTNSVCGYPNVCTTFRFDFEQDWSNKNVLNFDTHQFNGHYWMGFTLFVLDEDGNESQLVWRYDTVNTHWMTNSAPLSWFVTEEGTPATADDLKRVVGLQIAVDMAVNVTDEVALIFFDNIHVS